MFLQDSTSQLCTFHHPDYDKATPPVGLLPCLLANTTTWIFSGRHNLQIQATANHHTGVSCRLINTQHISASLELYLFDEGNVMCNVL